MQICAYIWAYVLLTALHNNNGDIWHLKLISSVPATPTVKKNFTPILFLMFIDVFLVLGTVQTDRRARGQRLKNKKSDWT